jgi:hypothetical protein
LARERLASQLELARYTTELKPKLSSFKNSNEPSRAELLTSEFERVCELRVFRPALLVLIAGEVLCRCSLVRNSNTSWEFVSLEFGFAKKKLMYGFGGFFHSRNLNGRPIVNI